MLAIQLVKKTLLVLLYLWILLVLTGCTFQPHRFGIIFTNGYADIYRIPDNTQSKVEQLTFTPTIGEYELFLSKNGDRVIFQAGPLQVTEEPSEAALEERQHIYLLDTASKKLADITNILVKYVMVPHDFSMDWSPDQKQFVIVTDDVVDSKIRSFLELIDFDGKNKKRILIPNSGEIPSFIRSVKWSPDGEKFILGEGVTGNEQQIQYPGNALLVYELKSGNIKRIADYRDNCFQEEWSPNSQQIVVSCSFAPPGIGEQSVSGPRTIRIFDMENPGQSYEHTGVSPCYDPSWSPDGKQIVIVCDKGTNVRGLFIINSDGNGIHEIKLGSLGNPAVLREPTWSPDGTQIVYVAGSDGKHQNIYTVNQDGSNNYPLTHQQSSYQDLSTYPIP